MAILAAGGSTWSGKATPAMNRDIVNPMPPRAPAPHNWRHEYASGFMAILVRTASHAAKTIPIGLPRTSPSAIAAASFPS